MEDKNYKIYAHISPSKKMYIGQTGQRLERRWRGGSAYKGCPAFYKAIQKYGWDNFKHIILCDNLTQEEANKKEVELIQKYNTLVPNGYNIEVGGGGHPGFSGELNPNYGNKWTDEQRQHMSYMMKKYYQEHGYPESTRRKLSEHFKGRYVGELNPMYGKYGELNPFYGKHHTKETREKLSKINKGKISEFKGHHHTEETKKILREKAKERYKNGEVSPLFGHSNLKTFLGKHHSEESKKKISEIKSEPVYALDDNMNIVFEFSSGTNAANYFHCARTCISNCITSGIEYTSQGYHWCKKEDYETKKKEFIKTKNRSSTIYQYDLDGNYIKSFPSAIEAENDTGVFSTSIIKCCHGKQLYAGNYQWRKDKIGKLGKVVKNESFMKTVYQYNTNGEFIREYNSITEASLATGINLSCISACCNGKQKTSGGFIWNFNNEVENNVLQEVVNE